MLRAVLGDNCSTEQGAAMLLAEARALRVDPLDFCAHRFGLGQDAVWSRAAQWAGLAFVEAAPSPLRRGDVPRLSALHGVRSFRGLRDGREVVYVAPGFEQVLALAASRAVRPDVALRACIVTPSLVRRAMAEVHAKDLVDHARQELLRRWPRESASVDAPASTRRLFVFMLAAIVGLAVLGAAYARPLVALFGAVLLMLPGLFRLAAAFHGLGRRSVVVPTLSDAELPVYSILVPLRDEAHMVPQLDRAFSAMAYPPEKLDILFVVEATSRATVAAVEALLHDPKYGLVVVPDSLPRTKPKAANMALPLARGEFIVVYDAEDAPAPNQLRLAASRFAADPGLACLQAELVPENGDESVLAALFTGEYAGLFGSLLPALAQWRMPIPLGGTSNHFRIARLREIGGWDAYNVTEDADLGVRLARRGMKTETLQSHTIEEAPLTLKAWMAQRTRWMKGWMLTFVVHNRRPRQLLADMGWRQTLAFEMLVGNMILASLLHSVFLALVLVRLAIDGPSALAPQDGWDWACVAVFAIGYGGALAVVVRGLLHLQLPRLLPVQLLLPLYWVLHSVAAIRAAHQLMVAPVFWAKTEHGISRGRRRASMRTSPYRRALRQRYWV